MKITTREHFLAPGICALCELAPDVAVDTLLNNNEFGPLSGRKYVCTNCVESLRRATGLTSDKRQKEVEQEAHELRERLVYFQAKVASLAEALVQDHLADFEPTKAPEPKKVPVMRKKAADVQPAG